MDMEGLIDDLVPILVHPPTPQLARRTGVWVWIRLRWLPPLLLSPDRLLLRVITT